MNLASTVYLFMVLVVVPMRLAAPRAIALAFRFGLLAHLPVGHVTGQGLGMDEAQQQRHDPPQPLVARLLHARLARVRHRIESLLAPVVRCDVQDYNLRSSYWTADAHFARR